jgi:predicted deacylase
VKTPTPAQAHRRAREFRAPHPVSEHAKYVERFRALGQKPGLEWTGSELHVQATRPDALRVLITASNHGDERVGPPAALKFVDWLLNEPSVRGQFDVTVIPFLSPEAFEKASRLNARGEDPNRLYDGFSAESQRIQRVQGAKAFDLAMDLHSSVRMDGFFFIGEPGSQAVAHQARMSVDALVPFTDAERPPYEKVEKGVFTSSNVGTLKSFLARLGTGASFTLEAPKSYSYRDGVEGLFRMMQGLAVTVERRPDAPIPTSAGCRDLPSSSAY